MDGSTENAASPPVPAGPAPVAIVAPNVDGPSHRGEPANVTSIRQAVREEMDNQFDVLTNQLLEFLEESVGENHKNAKKELEKQQRINKTLLGNQSTRHNEEFKKSLNDNFKPVITVEKLKKELYNVQNQLSTVQVAKEEQEHNHNQQMQQLNQSYQEFQQRQSESNQTAMAKHAEHLKTVLQANNADWSKTCKTHMATIEKLKKQAAGDLQKIETLKEENSALAKWKEANERASNIDKRALEKGKTKLAKDKADLEKQNADLVKEKTQLEETNKQLEAEKASLRKKLTKVEETNKQLEAEKASLRKQLTKVKRPSTPSTRNVGTIHPPPTTNPTPGTSNCTSEDQDSVNADLSTSTLNADNGQSQSSETQATPANEDIHSQDRSTSAPQAPVPEQPPTEAQRGLEPEPSTSTSEVQRSAEPEPSTSTTEAQQGAEPKPGTSKARTKRETRELEKKKRDKLPKKTPKKNDNEIDDLSRGKSVIKVPLKRLNLNRNAKK